MYPSYELTMLGYSDKAGSLGGASCRVFPVRLPTAPRARTERGDYCWSHEGGEGGE